VAAAGAVGCQGLPVARKGRENPKRGLGIASANTRAWGLVSWAGGDCIAARRNC